MPSLEERVAMLEARQADDRVLLKSIDAKVDELLRAFNMGKGGWMALAKIAGLFVFLAGLAFAAYDRVQAWTASHH